VSSEGKIRKRGGEEGRSSQGRKRAKRRKDKGLDGQTRNEE
jgi:hypothetical protein